MEIVISQEYRDSLVPLPEDILKDINIPEEPRRFLAETGLPLHAGYEITPNAPITFFERPYVKKYARRLEADPTFSLFDHEELYKPILAKLKEADPFAMRQWNFFWRRMCQPDIL